MELDNKDIDDVYRGINDVLAKLDDTNITSEKLKGVYIKQYRDWIRILVENKKLDIKLKEISSYVRHEVVEIHKVTYTDGHWGSLFEDDEKREGNYIKLPLGGVHEHEYDEEGNCTCGDKEIKGLHYTIVPDEIKKKKPPPPDKENFLTQVIQDLFKVNDDNARHVASMSRSLLSKGEDSKTAGIIIQSLPDANEILQTAKSETSTLNALDKKIDGRSKITEFMKLKAIILENIEYTIAHVANLLGKFCTTCERCEGVTPKHFTNNIKKTENPQTGNKNKHWNHIRWFSSINFKCGKCDNVNIVDINDWFTRQSGKIVDAKEPEDEDYLSMPFTDPIINYGVAE